MKLFELKLQSAYVCTNCKKVILNLYKNYTQIRDTCSEKISSMSIGNLSQSKLPVRRLVDPVSIGCVTTPEKCSVGNTKRLLDNSPLHIPSPVANKLYSPAICTKKRSKRELFAGCMYKYLHHFVLFCFKLVSVYIHCLYEDSLAHLNFA
jgi:DNA-directed RNA polymerase subunit RPC12/RpoP